MKKVDLQFSFSESLSEFLNHVYTVFIFYKSLGSCASVSIFLKNYIRQVLFFLNYLGDFIDKQYGPGLFFGERLVNNGFNFFNTYRTIHIFLSCSVSFGNFCFSKNLSISSKLSNLSL